MRVKSLPGSASSASCRPTARAGRPSKHSPEFNSLLVGGRARTKSPPAGALAARPPTFLRWINEIPPSSSSVSILLLMAPPSHAGGANGAHVVVSVVRPRRGLDALFDLLVGPVTHHRDGEKRMSTRAWSAIAIAFVVIGLQAGKAEARTVVVGSDATCQDSIKERYATIQAAVNASAIGGTVLVCPGTNPEQVVLSMPLIIKGVNTPASNGSSAVVTVPAAGLAPNASNGTVAPTVAQGVTG